MVMFKSVVLILIFSINSTGCATQNYVLADVKQKVILYEWTHTWNYESACIERRFDVLSENSYYSTRQRDLKCLPKSDYIYIYKGE